MIKGINSEAMQSYIEEQRKIVSIKEKTTVEITDIKRYGRVYYLNSHYAVELYVTCKKYNCDYVVVAESYKRPPMEWEYEVGEVREAKLYYRKHSETGAVVSKPTIYNVGALITEPQGDDRIG